MCPPKEAINIKENKEVKIMNVRFKKHQVSVMLNITADGQKWFRYVFNSEIEISLDSISDGYTEDSGLHLVC